jgi:serine kinase of HPr protein (carbohydrate metabolism regulator)
MTPAAAATVHASAVRVGDRAVLIRGASGAGKSRLAFDLILAGRAGQIPEAMLIGDDRVYLEAVAGELLVRPAHELAGLIEVRGLGLVRLGHLERAPLALVVDLVAESAVERLPDPARAELLGVALPLLALAPFQGSAAAKVRLAVLSATRDIMTAL